MSAEDDAVSASVKDVMLEESGSDGGSVGKVTDDEDMEDSALLQENDNVDGKDVRINLSRQDIVYTPAPRYNPNLAVNSKPSTAAALREARIRQQERIIQKHTSQTGKIVCGVVIILVVFGIGAGLVVLAMLLQMADLYIVGGIFLLGGVIFFFGFVVVRCQAAVAKYKELRDVRMSDIA